MEVLWNHMNLHRPPYRSWDISVREFDSRRFVETIENILNDFKVFESLHLEAALLSRLIYRMKSKFRNDKGLKHMEKVNRALLNYLNMSIEREYELLKEYTEINNDIVSLPSQQTLEYVLVRSQGFAKLMCRIESTALIAGNILKSRLHIGQSWSVAMIAYAAISRIWILSRYIIRKSCMWYKSIYTYSKIFKTVGISWLPDNYILPDDLSKWLDLPWFDENIEKLPMKTDWEKTIFNFINACDSTKSDLNSIPDGNCSVILTDSTKNEIKKSTGPKNKYRVDQDKDLGSPISRISFEKSSQKSEKEPKKKIESISQKKKTKDNIKLNKKSKLLNIKSEKDLVRLLKADSYSGFDKLQWNIFKKRLKKLIIKLTENSTIEINDQIIKKIKQNVKKWIQCK